MSFTKLAVKIAAPLPKIESFQRFMFLGPHPDDIEIGAGATAAKLAAMGKEICFVICTDGRFGNGHVDAAVTAEELVELRRAEAIASAKMTGISDVRFLGLSDGGFYDYDRLISLIAAEIAEFQPDVIFAPDPDTGAECHADHLNVGKAAKYLACFAPFRGIMAQYGCASAPVRALALYMTAHANHYVNTSGYFALQRRSIFECHKTQFPSESAEKKSLDLYLKLRSTDFGIRSFSPSAEGFRMLDQLRMHCLPEAGF